jgi:predicted branched-subunit amino acid permease
MPLWLGAVPFALVYTAAARQAGINPFEIQLMSLTIFSAPLQLSLVSLGAAGASFLIMLGVTLTLTVQLVLYGLSLRQLIRLDRKQRLAAAYFLTDGAYALTVTQGPKASFAYLLGAELSMYFIWNAGTLLGLLLNGGLFDPAKIGADFVVPLTFLVLLVPMVRQRADLVVVALCAMGSWALGGLLPSGLLVLVIALLAGFLGAWLSSPRKARNDA